MRRCPNCDPFEISPQKMHNKILFSPSLECHPLVRTVGGDRFAIEERASSLLAFRILWDKMPLRMLRGRFCVVRRSCGSDHR